MANIFVCQIALTSIELVNDDDDDDGIDGGVVFRAQARAQTHRLKLSIPEFSSKQSKLHWLAQNHYND